VADYQQDPASIRVYTFNRAAYLTPGAKITASTWEVPAPLTKTADAFTDTTTQITLTGGTVGDVYNLYNTFVSDDGQSQRLAFSLQVVDAAQIRTPTVLEQQLAALRVAISEAAISGTAEYQIGNRAKKNYTLEELLNYEKRLTQQVNQERQNAGAGIFKNHDVWMVEP